MNDDIIAEINMTPLIDIMLVLLILFMVTGSVSLESGLSLNLPKAGGDAPLPEKALVIGLDGRGRIFIQGQPVSLENLPQTVRRWLEKNQTRTVVLEGDRRSNLGKAMQIMDIARSAGAENFAIAAGD